jgi:hypothetical protein
MADSPLTFDTYYPPVEDIKGNLVKRRIQNVGGARSLWYRLQQADLASNKQMAKCQAMVDGSPPYDQDQLIKEGLGYMSNFNPGDAKAVLDTSLSAFYDLISGSESLIDVRTRYGEKSEQDDLSQRMSLHLSRVIRSWPSFPYRYAYIPHYFTLHGVGVAYFPDCYNWEWDVTNLAYMKIPRQTRACEDDLQYACMKKQELPNDLYRYIEMGEAAEAEGWNLDMLKRALQNASEQTIDPVNWMEWESRWKNNDLIMGNTGPTVPVVWMWVRELDGTISLMAFVEGGFPITDGEPEGFLCYKQSAYKSVQEAFVFFTRGIGTNGLYHGIRGLGADMYNAFQALMRLENRKIDVAFQAGPMFQAESEEAVEQFRITPYGANFLVTPGVSLLQVQPPNITTSIEPAVESLRQTVFGNIGQYTSAKTLDTGREQSKFEAMSRLELNAQLSVTGINLFMQPLDRLFNQVVRRFCRKGYQRKEPGGHLVWEWREMCLEDGIPEAALDQIDFRFTKASRTIGSGSPAARRLAFENMMPLYPYLDDFGKAQLVRLLTGSTVGWEIANQLTVPPNAEQRPPIDYAIAALQNGALSKGDEQPVLPTENKRIHLTVHIGNPQQPEPNSLSFYKAQFTAAGENPEMYAQIVPPMKSIYDHAALTLEGYTGTDAPLFRQQLQQFDETIVNGGRHLQKLQNEQAEAQGQEQQHGPSEAEKDIAVWRAKFDARAAEFQQKLEQRQAEAAQKRAIADANAAADIARKNIAAQAQFHSTIG